MIRPRAKKRRITAAQRGTIVQRVLVDGWSIEQAAATYGIAERHIAGWVTAYRRRGMASLRDAAFDAAPRRWLWLLRLIGARLAARLRASRDAPPARSIRLQRRDAGEGPADRQDRRSRQS
jgi:transposase-like protein